MDWNNPNFIRVFLSEQRSSVLFTSKDTFAINDSAMQLHEQGVDLEQEDDAAGFLGVTLERDPETRFAQNEADQADQTYNRSTLTGRWS